MKLSLRNVYRVARSLLFSVIVLVAALYLILYILLSVPFVQNELRDIAQREASKFIKGDVRIARCHCIRLMKLLSMTLTSILPRRSYAFMWRLSVRASISCVL